MRCSASDRAGFEVGAAFLSDDRPARLASAEATIDKVLSLRPNDARAHEVLGSVPKTRPTARPSHCRVRAGVGAGSGNLAAAQADVGDAKDFCRSRQKGPEIMLGEALRLSPHDGRAWLWMLFAGGARGIAWQQRRGRRVAPPLGPRSTGLFRWRISFLAAALCESWQAGRGAAGTQARLASIRTSPFTASVSGPKAVIRFF